MTTYYLLQEGKPVGPFSAEELSQKKLGRFSYVWHRSLSDWKLAGSLPELKDVIYVEPPPFRQLSSPATIVPFSTDWQRKSSSKKYYFIPPFIGNRAITVSRNKLLTFSKAVCYLSILIAFVGTTGYLCGKMGSSVRKMNRQPTSPVSTTSYNYRLTAITGKRTKFLKGEL